MQNKIEIPVEWGDTDPAAIVFYPNIFKWFDTGTWRLFIAAGLTYDVIREDFGLIGFPLVEASSKFMSPVRFGDTVELTSFVSEWGRKTFRVTHKALVNGKLCAQGVETRVVAKETADGTIKATIPPEEIRTRLPVRRES